MKTTLLNYLLFLVVLSLSATIYGQGETHTPVIDTIIPVGDPLSGDAFDKNIMQDINFMVLGDNNPKQGFSYEYDEKKTELSLSGALSSNKYFFTTIDGSFSVDDSAYIFDNKDGSKKGTLSLNLFAPAWFWNGKFYPAADDKDNGGKANRARHINQLMETERKKEVLDTFRTLDAIMQTFGFPLSEINNEKVRSLGGRRGNQHNLELVEKSQDTSLTNALDETELMKILLKYYKDPNPTAKYPDYKSLVAAMANGNQTQIVVQGEEDESSFTYNVPKGLDVEKLFEDYDKIVERAKNIDEEINDTQIKKFEDIWTSEYNTYFGLSPYYERESLETYNDDITIAEFSKRFTETRGDLYGGKISFNNVIRLKCGTFFMFRALATLGRGSNFSDFQKKDYVYNTLPTPIGPGVVVEEQKKTGYYTKNAAPYTYGFLQKYSAEVYASTKVFGVYGKFGYSKNEALAKKETLPLETGVMINVQSDKKSVVSILLFVAREDLNVHPDDDTNFGFKIGLPINIKKRDKEPEEKSK